VKVALLGNYPPDRQESMLRYTGLLLRGMQESGQDVEEISPRVHLRAAGVGGARKWLGYVDKYLLNLPHIRSAGTHADLVHICDHSNSVYIPRNARVPHVVTCHDLIAVRGALGEIADSAAAATGKLLQAAILRGLRRADAIACVSEATRQDLQRLAPDFAGEMVVIPNALNYDFRVLGDAGKWPLPAGLKAGAYLLMVGSAHRRKNRETALATMAQVATQWAGNLVIAGEPLSSEQWRLAAEAGVADRIVEIVKPSDATLLTLYNGALALLFPSRFEGFGWPLIEAQACGCPVICSDRPPMPEVTAGEALYCDADSPAAFAQAIVALARDPSLRARLVAGGIRNARRHTPAAMVEGFRSLYARLGQQA
jgi:glycosyltransferase involved in cell wall biosynthesis